MAAKLALAGYRRRPAVCNGSAPERHCRESRTEIVAAVPHHAQPTPPKKNQVRRAAPARPGYTASATAKAVDLVSGTPIDSTAPGDWP
jgi:hypothetical protein